MHERQRRVGPSKVGVRYIRVMSKAVRKWCGGWCVVGGIEPCLGKKQKRALVEKERRVRRRRVGPPTTPRRTPFLFAVADDTDHSTHPPAPPNPARRIVTPVVTNRTTQHGTSMEARGLARRTMVVMVNTRET